MAKTALQLANLALAELREPTISTFTESDYAALVLSKLNQAKREIEDTAPWDCLRTVLTFSTVSGTETYSLGTGGVATGGTTNERSYLVKDERGLPMIFDTTSKTQLSIVGKEYHRSLSQLNQMTNAQPGPVSILKANTGMTLRFYPKPNGIYAISSTWVIPQPDFAATGTELTVPHAPVYLRCASLLAEERGDGMGSRAAALKAMSDDALNDAIQFGRDMSELTAYVE